MMKEWKIETHWMRLDDDGRTMFLEINGEVSVEHYVQYGKVLDECFRQKGIKGNMIITSSGEAKLADSAKDVLLNMMKDTRSAGGHPIEKGAFVAPAPAQRMMFKVFARLLNQEYNEFRDVDAAKKWLKEG